MNPKLKQWAVLALMGWVLVIGVAFLRSNPIFLAVLTGAWEIGRRILVLAGIVLGALGLGQRLLPLIGAPPPAGVRLFALGLGLGAWSLLIFFIGLIGGWYAPVAWVITIAFIGLNWPELKQMRGGLSLEVDRRLLVLLVFQLAISFALCIVPPFAKDALVYHLAIPKLYLQHHHVVPIEENIYSFFPMGTEMFFIWGMMLDGDRLPGLFHFFFGVLTLFAMEGMSRTLKLRTPPLVNSLFLWSVPSVALVATYPYVDLAMVFFTTLTLWSFGFWIDSGRSEGITFAGLFCGFAIGTKYTGFFLFVLLALLILFHSRSLVRQGYELSLRFFILALLVASPWLIKNWWLTGNPVFPFLPQFFGAGAWGLERAESYMQFLRAPAQGGGLMALLRLPWDVTLYSRWEAVPFDGILGPIYLALAPLLFLPGQSKAYWMLTGLCGVFLLMWGFSSPQIRLLLPILPCLTILMMDRVTVVRGWIGRIGVLLVLLGAFWIAISTGYLLHYASRLNPFPVIIGLEKREAFLERILPVYPIFQYVNSHLDPKKDKVFFIYMKNFGYYCDIPYFSDSVFESYTIQTFLKHSDTSSSLRQMLKGLGFTHILMDEQFVFGDRAALSNSEQRQFQEFLERYGQPLYRRRSFSLFRLSL